MPVGKNFDWSVVPSEAARFENLVACHLLKWVHFEQDTRGRNLDLRYFRDLESREVDFVVFEGRRPRLLVECKWADAEPDRGCDFHICAPEPTTRVPRGT